LTRVSNAAAAHTRAEARARRTRQELHAAIKEAYAAGEKVALIAQVAGVSRQAVWQIVKKED
jgi:hypothetical protein